MKIVWDVMASEGLSTVPEGHRAAVRDRVIQWAGNAGAWAAGRQYATFRVGTMTYRAEAEFTAPDLVTVYLIEVD